MIKKENLRFTYNEKMWYCEILLAKDYVYLNGWGWGANIKQALDQALIGVKNT